MLLRSGRWGALALAAAITLATAGCSPQEEPAAAETPTEPPHQAPTEAPSQATDEAPAPSLRLTFFLDQWGQVADPEHRIHAIRVTDDVDVFDPDDPVSFEGEWVYHPDQNASQPPQRVTIRGAARKETGEVVTLAVWGEPQGPAVSQEKLGLLRPFFQAAIRVMNPSLPAEEEQALLQGLHLHPGGLESLRRELAGGSPIAVTQGRFRYRLGTFGSEEGATLELRIARIE